MTTGEEIIKNKLGLLKLGKELGNVSQACKIMGYSFKVRYPWFSGQEVRAG